MKELLNLYQQAVQLCLFRTSPLSLVSARKTRWLNLFISLLLGWVIARREVGDMSGIVMAAGELILLGLITAGLLALRQQLPRWQQTMTALLSTGVIMSLLGLPVLLSISIENIDTVSTPLKLLLLAFILWSLMVMAHIYRYTLNIRPTTAAIISIIVVVVVMAADGAMLVGMT